MSSEFECPKCGAYTIFRSIIDVREEDRCCANCDAQFEIEHMIRFDRTDNDKLGLLLPPEAAVDRKLTVVTSLVKELQERIENLEGLILDSHQNADTSQVDH